MFSKISMRRAALVALILALGLPIIASAQSEPRAISRAELKKRTLASRFSRLAIEDEEIKALQGDLIRKGYRPAEEKGNYWGLKQGWEIERRKLASEIVVRDFTKPGSRDIAALCQVTVESMNRKEVYSFYLIAPGGQFDRAEEFSVNDTLAIIPMHSWWSCVKGQLGRATASCAASLITCAPSPTWAAYLGCVALNCGIAYTRAAACCACNCKWYCKYAVGCCRK